MTRSCSNLMLALATLAGFASGCAVSEPPESTATGATVVRTPPPPPTTSTLAMVRVSPTHSVTFSESSDGDLEVLERMHADRDAGQPSLASLSAGTYTLAQLHRHVAPSAPVPEALVAADARAAARQAAPVDVEPPDDVFSAADAAGSLHAPPSAVAWDWNADKNWFAQHYYTGGTDGYFGANADWVHVTKKRVTSWYKASAFNQSFDAGAWFRVKRSYSCSPGVCSSTTLNEAVANRGITTYFGDTTRWRQAWLDAFGAGDWRVALAVRWVLANTNPPPAPPAGCGGHNQFVCFSGPRCQPGLHEYNAGCYACGTVGQACCKDWGPIPTPGGTQGFCVQGFCGYPGGTCQ